MSKMNLPPSYISHSLFWLFIGSLMFTFIWLFQSVLMPFLVGFAIAYLLNPLIYKLEKLQIGRKFSSLIILCLFFLLLFLFLAVISPIVIREMGEFIRDLPAYKDSLKNMISPYIEKIQEQFGLSSQGDIFSTLQPYIGKAANTSAGIFKQLLSGGAAIVDFTLTLFLTPIVAYFLLKDWPKITLWVNGLMPRDHEKTITGLLKQIDEKISGFVRGQLSVCVVLGLIYAIALFVAGLKYGFFIGLLAGALSIIPLIGSVVGLLVSVMVAWFQSGEMSYVGMIAAIFIIGQVVEGNLLTPKLVGDSVGLHPLWIIFALMAGGAILGIFGMLLAVPIAATAGVLIGFSIERYHDSVYFKKTLKKKPVKKKVKKAKA